MGILRDGGQRTAEVGSAPAAPTRCPSCGGARREGLSFCGRCGYDFGQPFAPAPTQLPVVAAAPTRGGERNLERLLIAGIAVAAVIGVVALLNPFPATEVATRDLIPAASGRSAASSAATSTPSLSPAPSSRIDVFAGQPYTLDLPAGWMGFDPTNPATKAATDALLAANPALVGPFQGFQAMPNVRMAVQTALGNVLVVVPMASGGLSLDALGQSVTAQLRLIPGLNAPPAATKVTLPAGEALHWDLTLTVNKVGGGTTQVRESVYLFADTETAFVVEFVSVGSGASADEVAIVRTFRFAPRGMIS